MRKDGFDEDEYEDDGLPSSERPRRHWLFRLLCTLTILALIWFVGLCLFIDIYGHYDQAQRAQAVVILGAGVLPGGQPGDSLHARTLQAVAIYKSGKVGKIICTGGLGDNAPTEAQVAADLATKQGVLPGDLLLEMKSTTTLENAKFAAEICRKEHWTHVVVVSDPYHLWRAYRDFSAQGLTVYTSPAKLCERNRNFLLRLAWTAREGLAVTRDLLGDAGHWLLKKL